MITNLCSVNTYRQRVFYKNLPKSNQTFSNLQVSSQTRLVEIPAVFLPHPVFVKAAPQISFGYAFELKKVKNLPCPCCGQIMLTVDESNEFAANITDATGDKLIKHLCKYKNRFLDKEKNVTTKIIIAAQKHPDLKINELLQSIVQEQNKNLNKDKVKLKSLNRVKNIAKNLRGKTLIKVNNKLASNDTANIVQDITKIRDNEQDSRNKQILNNILQIIETKPSDMPYSDDPEILFIFKYSKRKPDEIAHRLIRHIEVTTEHIKPFDSFKKEKNLEGCNEPSNYLVECGKCNNNRGHMPLTEWLKFHPEMVKNTQIYIDEVTDRIIKGEIKGFDDYLPAVKKSLLKESGGKINIDITRMKNYSAGKAKSPKPDIPFKAGLRFCAVG